MFVRFSEQTLKNRREWANFIRRSVLPEYSFARVKAPVNGEIKIQEIDPVVYSCSGLIIVLEFPDAAYGPIT
jgi:hypothetical protein